MLNIAAASLEATCDGRFGAADHLDSLRVQEDSNFRPPAS